MLLAYMQIVWKQIKRKTHKKHTRALYIKKTTKIVLSPTHMPILRLRKNGIARPCIYFDVTSLAFYTNIV
jgi:hypothetical protein